MSLLQWPKQVVIATWRREWENRSVEWANVVHVFKTCARFVSGFS